MMSDVPLRFIAVVFCYNEGGKIKRVLARFPETRDYDVLLVDDGSTDESVEIIRKSGFPFIRHDKNLGVGAGLRSAISYARSHGYDALIIMAGNGKMAPEEVPRLIEPIRDGGYDYVQGSRYLEGGSSDNLPFKRAALIKIFTWIVNLFMGSHGTDVTCGFRAYRLDIIERSGMKIDQPWLGRYEMEYYIHYYVLKRNLRVIEVPVGMTYPSEGKNYSKIKAGSGWWSMVRPWVLLILHLKK
jgi:dolichol-phosphate mannosyltransferase